MKPRSQPPDSSAHSCLCHAHAAFARFRRAACVDPETMPRAESVLPDRAPPAWLSKNAQPEQQIRRGRHGHDRRRGQIIGRKRRLTVSAAVRIHMTLRQRRAQKSFERSAAG